MFDLLREKMKSGNDILHVRQQFEQMFTEYYTELVVYVNTYTKDTPSAEDIVQEMFCNLWDKRESHRVHTSIRAFLFRSARNAVLNYLTRTRQITVKLSEQLADELLFQDDMEIARRDTLLYALIERLPEQRKRIFKLCFFDDLKYAEVASRLGISVNTVKTQMGRAMAELRETAGELLLLFLLKK
ncbi:MAG: RNA polymerase sigma-70 factor [Odoribacteraceae bacterium]|jgi:RNA polymerase sigma-70 factor (ECF subfamily)|nr:RNA polymerase sigma-70 factor [Odoribacteraceae bacterium]